MLLPKYLMWHPHYRTVCTNYCQHFSSRTVCFCAKVKFTVFISTSISLWFTDRKWNYKEQISTHSSVSFYIYLFPLKLFAAGFQKPLLLFTQCWETTGVKRFLPLYYWSETCYESSRKKWKFYGVPLTFEHFIHDKNLCSLFVEVGMNVGFDFQF